MIDGRKTHVAFGPGSPGQIIQGAFVCDNCKRISAAYTESDYAHAVGNENADNLLTNADDVRWFPRPSDSPTIHDVPAAIARAAEEAWASASINAHMSAILMARTVIEATAKAKSITTGTLLAKIDEMEKQNLIRPGIAQAAHEVRHFGNNMAHGDIEDRPSAEDAEDILELMMQVLREVFQGPALVDKMKARRTAKKAPAATRAGSSGI